MHHYLHFHNETIYTLTRTCISNIYAHTHGATICVNKKRCPMNSVNKNTQVYNCKNLHLHDFHDT